MALYNRARNTRFLVITLVMVSLLTITVDYRGGRSGPFEVAGRATYTVVATIQSAVSRVIDPIGSFFSGIAHIASLRSENEVLKQRVRQLQAQVGRSTSLNRVTTELGKLAKLEGTLKITGVTARVTAESVGNFQWSVNVDKGARQGVRVNDPVVAGDGLVGHVVYVGPTASMVQLVIDPKSAVAARLSTSGETGLVVGQTDKRDLKMDLVNREAKVLPDEQVVTSGYQGGLYQAEIPIGVVSHIYPKQGNLNEIIDVRPAVDFTALEFVLIVTNG
jgi:rod shape-determining protein MreC